MTRFLSLAAAAIMVCSYTQAQTDYSVKLSDEQVKTLRNRIINEYEDHRANTMDWARFSRYAKDNLAVTQRPKAVLMGNSITEGWAEKDGQWLKDHNLVGRGISGQVSSQMLVRFRQDVISLKPQCVVIMCGINDIALNQGRISVDNVMGNIISMVELAKANKIRPYLCSVTPAKSIGWRPEVKDTPEQIKALNRLISDYARQQKITYIDYFSALVDPADGISMIKEYTADGLHPNLQGYKVMEEILAKTLKIEN